ncbi:extracellular solute-binding protein, partial [Cohnella sp.]|uniref:extracellular solute-binding protein n=1 Tax=Cohnella sp. TaxID=1883426 RepID=UPI0037039E3F
MRTSKRKVWLKLGLLIAMVFTVVACSGNDEGSTTGSNEPGTSSEGVGAPVELRIFRVAVTQDPTKDRVLLELQKRTNTKLEFITTPWDQYVTKSNTMLASKEKVDIIALEDSQLNYPKLARSGILTPLDDLLNSGKYPNLKVIATDPLFKKYLIDGKIYGIPQLTQPSGGWIAGIRTDWLKNVGLPMPRTPEDLYNVFKAFKENDPDQNGLDDTLAMYVTPFDPWGFLMTAFVQPVAFKEENGSIVYTATSPE